MICILRNRLRRILVYSPATTECGAFRTLLGKCHAFSVASHVSTELLKLKTGTALGVKIELGATPLILIKAEKGFAMCGYLDIETADRLGDVAVIAKGKNFEELLNAKPMRISEKAKALSITPDMTVKEALEKMF